MRRRAVAILGVVVLLSLGASAVVAGADGTATPGADDTATGSAQACEANLEGVFTGENGAGLADMVTIEYTIYNTDTNQAVETGTTTNGRIVIDGSFEEGTNYALEGQISGTNFADARSFDPCSAPSVSVPVPIYDLGVPFVEFQQFPDTPSPAEEVNFEFDGIDRDQDITSYRWDFDNDGTVDATGPEVTTTFDQPGTYNVKLTVEDEKGYVNDLIRPVTVEGQVTCSDSTQIRFTDEVGNVLDQQFTYTVTNRSSGATTEATATGGTDTYSGSFKAGVSYLVSTTVDGTAHETVVEGCPGETVRVTVEDFVQISDDAFEDNDDIDNATEVPFGETTTDLIALRDDADYYAVDVPATTQLNATVSYDDSEAKPVVSIYEPDGTIVNASAQSGGQSTTTALVPGAETFYVRVDNGPSDAVAYSLTTTAEPVAQTCSPTIEIQFRDENEELIDDQTVSWTLNDTYGGILASGETSNGMVSQQVTLINRNALPAQFGYEVNGTTPGYELDIARGEISCSDSLIGVQAFFDRTDLPDNDDYEGNDDRGSATTLTDSQDGEAIVVAGEDDWYAFDYRETRESDVPDHIGLRVSFNGSTNIQAAMYAQDGTLLDTGYSDTPSEFVGIDDPRAGTIYYVRVNTTDGSTGSYRFHADTRPNVDIPDTIVADRYGARLPEGNENDFPVMPQLAPNRTQSLRIEQAAWLDGSGAPENRTIRLEGAVEGTPTAEMTLRNSSELLWLNGIWGVGSLGFTNVTPTDTGEDVIRVVYEDGTPLKRLNSASTDDSGTRADFTIDVDPDPETTEFEDLTIADGNITVRVEEEVGNDPVSFARVSLRDNGTIVETVTANRSAFATLSLTADLGTNLSLYTATAGWGPNALNISVPSSERPGLPGVRPTLPGQANAAANLDGDAKLEDVNGDGEGNIFDVITYYNNRKSDVIASNPTQFDFDEDGAPGTLFDALALYNELSN